jgi:hypothetical protein
VKRSLLYRIVLALHLGWGLLIGCWIAIVDQKTFWIWNAPLIGLCVAGCWVIFQCHLAVWRASGR